MKNVHEKFTRRENEVRLFIMNEIVSSGKMFDLDQERFSILRELGMSEQEYREICETLIKKDGMVTDGSKVQFIYPVSALETKHRVILADGREFTAMCAIDAIGAAFTFHQDTEIHSTCARCGEPVHIEIKDGKLSQYTPKNVHALSFELGEFENWAGSC